MNPVKRKNAFSHELFDALFPYFQETEMQKIRRFFQEVFRTRQISFRKGEVVKRFGR